ncbi:unnamed protein product [Polarella glacialis]|uniref:Uncharacterized protein n=1 Tax=Polarella glacialis TaxID=89957 RepID=A0A813JS49_POLGL|nr:unnamed protein product [Polarella glacialis]
MLGAARMRRLMADDSGQHSTQRTLPESCSLVSGLCRLSPPPSPGQGRGPRARANPQAKGLPEQRSSERRSSARQDVEALVSEMQLVLKDHQRDQEHRFSASKIQELEALLKSSLDLGHEKSQESLLNRIQELEAQLDSAISNFNKTDQELQSQKAQNAELQSSSVRLTDRLLTSEEQLEARRKQSVELEAGARRVQEIEAREQEAFATIEKLNEQSEARENYHLATMEQLTTHSKARERDLSAQVQQLQQEVYKDPKRQMGSLERVITNTEGQVSDYLVQIDQLQKEATATAADRSAREADMRLLAQLEVQVPRMQREEQEHQNIIDRMVRESAAAAAANRAAREADTQRLSELDAAVSELKRKEQDYLQIMDNLKHEASTAFAHCSDMESDSKQLYSLKGEFSDLQRQSNDFVTENSHLKREAAKFDAATHADSQRIAGLEAVVSELQRQNQEPIGDLSRLQPARQADYQRIQGLESLVNDMKRQEMDQQPDILRLQKETADANAARQSDFVRMSNLEVMVSDFQSQSQQYLHKIDSLQRDAIDGASSTGTARQADLERIGRLEGQLSEMQRREMETQIKEQDFITNIDHLHREAADTASTHASASRADSQRLADLEGLISDLRRREQGLLEEVAELQSRSCEAVPLSRAEELEELANSHVKENESLTALVATLRKQVQDTLAMAAEPSLARQRLQELEQVSFQQAHRIAEMEEWTQDWQRKEQDYFAQIASLTDKAARVDAQSAHQFAELSHNLSGTQQNEQELLGQMKRLERESVRLNNEVQNLRGYTTELEVLVDELKRKDTYSQQQCLELRQAVEFAEVAAEDQVRTSQQFQAAAEGEVRMAKNYESIAEDQARKAKHFEVASEDHARKAVHYERQVLESRPRGVVPLPPSSSLSVQTHALPAESRASFEFCQAGAFQPEFHSSPSASMPTVEVGAAQMGPVVSSPRSCLNLRQQQPALAPGIQMRHSSSLRAPPGRPSMVTTSVTMVPAATWKEANLLARTASSLSAPAQATNGVQATNEVQRARSPGRAVAIEGSPRFGNGYPDASARASSPMGRVMADQPPSVNGLQPGWESDGQRGRSRSFQGHGSEGLQRLNGTHSHGQPWQAKARNESFVVQEKPSGQPKQGLEETAH